jgi:cytochrome c
MHRLARRVVLATAGGPALALALSLGGLHVAAASDPAPAPSAEDAVPEPAEVCLSCHAIRADEPALEGPTLWGVVGRPIASAPDFAYSDALRRLEGNWDRDRLDRFLAAPQAYAPGARMTFGGVRSAADRKVVLDFLETLAAAEDD